MTLIQLIIQANILIQAVNNVTTAGKYIPYIYIYIFAFGHKMSRYSGYVIQFIIGFYYIK